MSSLIHQSHVVAVGQISENQDAYILADGSIWSKSILEGAILVDEEPQGSSTTGWGYFNGTFIPVPVYVSAKDAELASDIRAQRNVKLSASDWTQVADAASRCDQAAWATYRQQLCDITEQAGFPKKVVWPTNPNGAI